MRSSLKNASTDTIKRETTNWEEIFVFYIAQRMGIQNITTTKIKSHPNNNSKQITQQKDGQKYKQAKYMRKP